MNKDFKQFLKTKQGNLNESSKWSQEAKSVMRLLKKYDKKKGYERGGKTKLSDKYSWTGFIFNPERVVGKLYSAQELKEDFDDGTTPERNIKSIFRYHGVEFTDGSIEEFENLENTIIKKAQEAAKVFNMDMRVLDKEIKDILGGNARFYIPRHTDFDNNTIHPRYFFDIDVSWFKAR